jgi:hypothetical protein
MLSSRNGIGLRARIPRTVLLIVSNAFQFPLAIIHINRILDIDAGAAQSANLAYVNDKGNFIMAVETTPRVSGNRKSVRITTKASYTGGIVIMDSIHMPTGCGSWRE